MPVAVGGDFGPITEAAGYQAAHATNRVAPPLRDMGQQPRGTGIVAYRAAPYPITAHGGGGGGGFVATTPSAAPPMLAVSPQLVYSSQYETRWRNVVVPKGKFILVGLWNDGGVQLQLPRHFYVSVPAGWTLADMIRVRYTVVGTSLAPPWLYVTKSTTGPFRIEIANPDAKNDSPPLEVSVLYTHSLTR